MDHEALPVAIAPAPVATGRKAIGGAVAQLTEGNRLEIMELMTPDKMLDV